VPYRILSHHDSTFVIIVAARIQVAIKARKVAAGNLQADAVSRWKVIARGVQVYGQVVNLTGLHPDLLVESLAVSRPENPILKVERRPVGINIDKLRREIGVACALRDE
jgi:hypothetical protein